MTYCEVHDISETLTPEFFSRHECELCTMRIELEIAKIRNENYEYRN